MTRAPTAFALLIQLCGLSSREAADFLGVRDDTARNWRTGRDAAPEGVLRELAEMVGRIETAADEAVGVLEQAGAGPGGVVELGYAADDAEARSLGWPCAAAHRAALAPILAWCLREGVPVEIVPRGATPATAAADARER